LDIDPTRVHDAATAGEHVVYGDAGRRQVLQAAGADRAKALIVSYSDMRSSMKVLHAVQDKYPDLPVIVRTYDDANIDAFKEAGATEVVPEILEGSLMLASHALVLLGVPLNRVVKRIRLFREARYKMFKGFFRGMTDADAESLGERSQSLHAIEIQANAYAQGMAIAEIPFEHLGVELKQLRRPNMLEAISPRPDIVLSEGDVLVLLGSGDALVAAEIFIVSGK
jgi:monovalent cation:H+ antiporter-2, CPA2 family